MEKRKYGFTLVELLVVMVIITILAGLLLPAIRKARAKALVDKATAEMTGLASAITMAKLDCGYYVRLCDLASPDTTAVPIRVLDTSVLPAVWEDPDLNPGDPYYISNWDGPYQVFQEKGVLSSTTGSIPTDKTGTWDLSPNGDDFPAASTTAPVCKGSPLDSWGRAYGLAYNGTNRVMIIYSAGPNGELETGKGAVNKGDSNANGVEDEDWDDSDDILYKFR